MTEKMGETPRTIAIVGQGVNVVLSVGIFSASKRWSEVLERSGCDAVGRRNVNFV